MHIYFTVTYDFLASYACLKLNILVAYSLKYSMACAIYKYESAGTLQFKQERAYGDMQRDSSFEFFAIELRLTLTFRTGQES